MLEFALDLALAWALRRVARVGRFLSFVAFFFLREKALTPRPG